MRPALFAALLLAACAVPAEPAAPSAPVAPLPLFDAHVHYNAEASTRYPPEEALAILRRAGVRRALVSSTPDESTFRLYERAPALVVPFLRPYRHADDIATWTRDPEVAAYVEARFTRGAHRGVGELHLGAERVAHATVRALVGLARREDLFLHVHGPALAIEELFRLEPRLRILWAHAGLSATPDTVGRLPGATRRSGRSSRSAATSPPKGGWRSPGGLSSCAIRTASWWGAIRTSRTAGSGSRRSSTTCAAGCASCQTRSHSRSRAQRRAAVRALTPR